MRSVSLRRSLVAPFAAAALLLAARPLAAQVVLGVSAGPTITRTDVGAHVGVTADFAETAATTLRAEALVVDVSALDYRVYALTMGATVDVPAFGLRSYGVFGVGLFHYAPTSGAGESENIPGAAFGGGVRFQALGRALRVESKLYSMLRSNGESGAFNQEFIPVSVAITF